MTSIAHERFHAVAEEPAYARENAPAVGRSAPAAISLTGLEKVLGPIASCAASTCIFRQASSSP